MDLVEKDWDEEAHMNQSQISSVRNEIPLHDEMNFLINEFMRVREGYFITDCNLAE